MENVPTTPKRFKILRKIGMAFLILLAVLVLIIIGLHIHSQRQLNQRIAADRAAGLPTTLEELNQWPVPPITGPTRNSYLLSILPADSALTMPPDPPASIAAQIDENGRLMPPAADVQLTQEELQYYRRLLVANDKLLRKLHQMVELPVGRQGYDYRKDYDRLMPQLASFRPAAILLSIESTVAVHFNRPDDAIRSITAIAAIAETLQNEPSAFCGLICTSIQEINANQIRRLLGNLQMTDEKLALLADIPQPPSRHMDRLRASLVGERLIFRHRLCMGKTERDRMIRELQIDVKGLSAFFSLHQALGLSKLEIISYHDYLEPLIAATYMPPHEMHRILQSHERPSKRNMFTHILASGLQWIPAIHLRAIADSHCTSTAIAIQRYRLAHGQLPDSLNNLVPQYLDAVPADPFDGQPLRYEKLEPGYVVYSLGENLQDDGGTPRSQDNPYDWDIAFTVNN